MTDKFDKMVDNRASDEKAWDKLPKGDARNLVHDEKDVVKHVIEGVNNGSKRIVTGNFQWKTHKAIARIKNPSFYYLLSDDEASIDIISFQTFWELIKTDKWLTNLTQLNKFILYMAPAFTTDNAWFSKHCYAIVHNYMTFIRKNKELKITRGHFVCEDQKFPCSRLFIERVTPLSGANLPDQDIVTRWSPRKIVPKSRCVIL